jgi:MerR family transcriptional regulator, copper efflux regulator
MSYSPTQPLLKIGEVATSSGLSVKTIRYYEQLGLLSPNVSRSDTQYRLFDPVVVDRLNFIKRAQSLGLALTEIKDILAVHDQGQLPCHEVKQHLQEKMKLIDRQIEVLMSLRSELQDLLSHWQEHPLTEATPHRICPNIQTGNAE